VEIYQYSDSQLQLIEQIKQMAAEKFAPRAQGYDDAAELPLEDLRDLHKTGFLTACLDKAHGGMGYGADQDDPLAFFLITQHIAQVNPATAHCFQVHNNCVQMLNELGSDEQIERFLEPTRERGAVIPGLGSEPSVNVVGGALSTIAKDVDGGVVVNGTKHYGTDVTGSEWMWVVVLDEKTQRDQTVMIPTNHPGVTTYEEQWEPVGMRACVSPKVTIEDVFVPTADIVGEPGGFLGKGWLPKINMGFSANYLGNLEGVYQGVVSYITERNRGDDTTRQRHVGEMKSRIDAIKLMLYTAINGYQRAPEGALLMIEEAKWLAVESANRFHYLVGQAAGPSVLFRNHPVERLMRDLLIHGLHGRHHVTVETVGKKELGQPFRLGLSV